MCGGSDVRTESNDDVGKSDNLATLRANLWRYYLPKAGGIGQLKQKHFLKFATW